MTIKLAKMSLVLSVSLLCTIPALAETVFRSVDENGVVTFSDTPPDGDAEVESITIDTPEAQSPEAARQRLEDMRETTDRMAADRREREKHRAEMRELQARTQPQSQNGQVPYYSDYYPVYSGGRIDRRRYYGGTPWRPGYGTRPGIGDRPRPEHPIARPPLRPGAGYHPGYGPQPDVNLGSNSQLMRPIVSPRR
jgi:hypothetical protein